MIVRGLVAHNLTAGFEEIMLPFSLPKDQNWVTKREPWQLAQYTEAPIEAL